MKTLKKTDMIELTTDQCIQTKANGWPHIIFAIIDFIASEWSDVKQGFKDGSTAVKERY